MNVGGIPVSNILSSNFSLQTISYALLKSSRASTEHCIRQGWKPTSTACTIQVIWSSQLQPLQNPAWNGLNRFFGLRSARICSRSLATQDVLDGRKDVTSLEDFLAKWFWQSSRFLDNEQLKKMSWIWIVIRGGLKDWVTWEMMMELCQGQLLLCTSYFW